MFDRIRNAYLVLRGQLPFNFVPPIDGSSSSAVTSPMEQSAWVLRAIKKISGPIASVPVEFEIMQADGSREDYAEPMLDEFWRDPFQHWTCHDGIEATVGWLKLKGEAFWVVDDTWTLPFMDAALAGQMPGKILIVNPDAMKEVVENGVLIGWTMRIDRRGSIDLTVNQVIQMKYWNPSTQWRGLPEYLAASLATESDYLANRFIANLMRNNGSAGQFVIGKNGIASKEQQDQITAQLRLKRQLQDRGIARDVFLAGDIDVKNPSVQAPDAGIVAVRLGNRHEIATAFGLPPSIFDPKESYSIGSNSDYFALIHDTCIPTGMKIDHAITQLSRRLTRKPVMACRDWDDHPVMRAVRAERMAIAKDLFDRGWSWESINDYLELGMSGFDGWDVGYLPFNLAPMNRIASAETAPPEASPMYAEDAIEQMKLALRSGTVRRDRHVCSFDVPPRGLSPRQLAQWKTLAAKRRETIHSYQSSFNRVVVTACAEVIGKIESAESAKSVQAKTLAADFMFDLATFAEGFKVAMRNAGQRAVDAALGQLATELGKDDPFTLPPAKVLNFLHARENRLAGVPEEVFQRIKTSLEEGINDGESMKKLADRIRAERADLTKYESMRIAQTETSSAYGFSRHEGMREAGIQRKRWLTSGNPNVRPAHEAANGQTVGIDQPFEVGGEELMYPGDSSGSPENVINCHCVSIAVGEGEEA